MMTSSKLFSETVSFPKRSLLRLLRPTGVRRLERRLLSFPTARAGAPMMTEGRETTTEERRVPGWGLGLAALQRLWPEHQECAARLTVSPVETG